MKDYKWKMNPDSIFEAKRMSNGKLVRGQLIGESPFVYILTEENYKESVMDPENCRGECLAQLRLVRVIGNSVRKVDPFARLTVPADKNSTDFGVGDVVSGKCRDGFAFDGKIFRIEIKKEDGQLHPIIFVRQLTESKVDPFGHAAIWVDQIAELEILQFKEESAALQ